MPAQRLFSPEDVSRHLAAVRTLKDAGPITALVTGRNGKFAAFSQGFEVAIQYLAKRFGACLKTDCRSIAACRHSGSTKTWELSQIETILKETYLIMLQESLLPTGQGDNHAAFRDGIEKGLRAVAVSFGLSRPLKRTTADAEGAERQNGHGRQNGFKSHSPR